MPVAIEQVGDRRGKKGELAGDRAASLTLPSLRTIGILRPNDGSDQGDYDLSWA